MTSKVLVNDQLVTKSTAKETISNLLAQIYDEKSGPETQKENLMKSLELAQEIAMEFEMINMQTRLSKAMLRLRKGLITVEKIPEFTFNLCMTLEGMGNYKCKGTFVNGTFKKDAPGRNVLRKDM